MYICICRFYVWYKITDERRNFFWWGQPSPIDIVNCNSVGNGSKKRSGSRIRMVADPDPGKSEEGDSREVRRVGGGGGGRRTWRVDPD